MTEQLRQKKENLEQWMADHVKEGICIAFSAGVDSSLLLKLACDAGKAAGVPIWAVTFSTKLHPHGELEDARQAAAELGAEHIVLEGDERSQEGIQNNPPDRCYICKKYLFTNLLATAEKVGAKCVVEGTNEDDLHVYRPGIRAVRELHVNSPLALFHLTKAEVRELAAELGVQAASKCPFGRSCDLIACIHHISHFYRGHTGCTDVLAEHKFYFFDFCRTSAKRCRNIIGCQSKTV